VHRNCRLIIVSATRQIYLQAVREGLIDIFVEAGAMAAPPTCGACFGGQNPPVTAGERAVTTRNCNFRGRMRSREAEVHLANASVAAAAVAGEITHPQDGIGKAP